MAAQQDPVVERQDPFTVVLIDDEPLIRAALSQTLSGAGFDLVGEAATAADAFRLVADLSPDVVVMDIRLPDSSGVHAIEQLSELAPASHILVLTRTEENRVVEAIVAGASGYILKTAPAKAIIAAVRATATGESVISPQVAGKLLRRIRELHVPVAAGSQDIAASIRAALTKRELEIFERLASGASNEQIARDLHVSPNTIANHIASILVKLQLENRTHAAAHAVRSGIA
ncbi:MAG: response regulator transcription factor [Solirubrobacteraceae bacterium]